MEKKYLFLLVMVEIVASLDARADNSYYHYKHHNDDYGSGWYDYDEYDEYSSGYDDHQESSGEIPPKQNVYPTEQPETDDISDQSSDTATARVDIGKSHEEDDENVTLSVHPAFLIAVIIGGLLVLTVIVMLIVYIVYRMRKRDEGSYALDDPTSLIPGQKHSASGYTKALMADQEFYA